VAQLSRARLGLLILAQGPSDGIMVFLSRGEHDNFKVQSCLYRGTRESTSYWTACADHALRRARGRDRSRLIASPAARLAGILPLKRDDPGRHHLSGLG